ncbi:MAG: 4Fe-4S dicluster domain-containing protein [Candidatus Thiodiazotropha sp. LLP2]
MQKLNDYFNYAKDSVQIADIIEDRCVHSNIEVASCKACVDVCPKDAWLLDDESLLLNESVCDGCGLCSPACPEGAITINNEILVGQLHDSSIAICACEYTIPADKEGVLPCINAIGLQEILTLYERGISKWSVTTLECNDCKRGKGVHLSEKINHLNNSLRKTGKREIRLSLLSIREWLEITQSISEDLSGPKLSRRGFLEGIISTGFNKRIELQNSVLTKSISFKPPGKLLPKAIESHIWPFLPEIDSHSCNGCNACVKVCQHQAIQLLKFDTEFSYYIQPEACSGCKMCSDVCELDAVTVREWKSSVKQQIELTSNNCSSCGNLFHIPKKQSDENAGYCQICRQQNINSNLYQILK